MGQQNNLLFYILSAFLVMISHDIHSVLQMEKLPINIPSLSITIYLCPNTIIVSTYKEPMTTFINGTNNNRRQMVNRVKGLIQIREARPLQEIYNILC